MSIETVFVGVKEIDVKPVTRQISYGKEIVHQQIVVTMDDGQVHYISMHLKYGSNALAYGEVIKPGDKLC